MSKCHGYHKEMGFVQALNMKVELGTFGDESTWSEPGLNQLELWWKNLLYGLSWMLPMKEKAASRVLLEEACSVQPCCDITDQDASSISAVQTRRSVNFRRRTPR